MEKFIIFASNFLIIVYSSIIGINYLSQQQFSAFNLAQYKWNLPNVHFHPMPAQAPSQNSRPMAKIITSLDNCQIKRKILHHQIILFSNNSFAILSIPYSQFKNMSRHTSSRQKKKDRKATNAQVKIAAVKSIKFIPTAALKTVVEHVSNTSDLNRMDRQEPQTLANTALTAHAQAKKEHKAFQEQLPTAGNNRSVELGSRNTGNLAHIDYFMEKHFAPLNRRDTQEPEVLGKNAPSTAIPTPRIQHGSKVSKLPSDMAPANSSLIQDNQRNTVRQLIRNNKLQYSRNKSSSPADMINTSISTKHRATENIEQKLLMQFRNNSQCSRNSSQYSRKQSINPAVMIPTGISPKRRSIGNLGQQISRQSYGPNSAPNPSANSNLPSDMAPANSSLIQDNQRNTVRQLIRNNKLQYSRNKSSSPADMINTSISTKHRATENIEQKLLMQFRNNSQCSRNSSQYSRKQSINPAVMIPTGISPKRRSIGNLGQQISRQSYGPNSAPNPSANSNLPHEINSAVMVPAASTTLRPIEGSKQKSFMESYGLNFALSPSANNNLPHKLISAGMIPAAIPIRRWPNENFQQQILMQFNGPDPHLNSTANTNRTAAMKPETTVKLYNRYTLIATFAHIKLTYPSIPPFPYLLRNLNFNLFYMPQDYYLHIFKKYCNKLTYLSTSVLTTLVNYMSAILYLQLIYFYNDRKSATSSPTALRKGNHHNQYCAQTQYSTDTLLLYIITMTYILSNCHLNLSILYITTYQSTATIPQSSLYKYNHISYSSQSHLNYPRYSKLRIIIILYKQLNYHDSTFPKYVLDHKSSTSSNTALGKGTYHRQYYAQPLTNLYIYLHLYIKTMCYVQLNYVKLHTSYLTTYQSAATNPTFRHSPNLNASSSLSTQVERPKAVGVPTTSKYDVTHILKVPTTLLTTPNPTNTDCNTPTTHNAPRCSRPKIPMHIECVAPEITQTICLTCYAITLAFTDST